jgi:hypothetical protein
MLSVVMLSVARPSVVILSVAAPFEAARTSKTLKMGYNILMDN